MVKLPTEEEASIWVKKFEPYYPALGRTAHAWNHLQEELANLFSDLTHTDHLGLALWHSLKSDRSQRDLLEAALKYFAQDEDWTARYPRANDDITWLLNETNKLADKRNDAIHAPITMGIRTGELEIVPFSFYGNPRAKKLLGKQILREFEWYERCADTLRKFAVSVDAGLRGALPSWPERPQLPALQQDASRTAPRPRSGGK
jgi:hypothetical protein